MIASPDSMVGLDLVLKLEGWMSMLILVLRWDLRLDLDSILTSIWAGTGISYVRKFWSKIGWSVSYANT
jgi:hypothetical protein